jgi:hypothetical protein
MFPQFYLMVKAGKDALPFWGQQHQTMLKVFWQCVVQHRENSGVCDTHIEPGFG